MTDYRTRVHQRMDELSFALRPGWHDGEGRALSPAVLAMTATIAESTAQWAGQIHIYPTLEGGAQIEWSDEHASHSITIGPDLRTTLDTTERSGAGQPETHRYLSTGCLHGQHDYCKSNTGAAGTKTPAVCKFCAAPCRCRCHADARSNA